ncbi:hypothetical protein ES702_00195 [subsurface metagenome]
MPGSERSLPSSPAPGASPEESLKFYKTQYELLEAELAEFQTSSKDLEAELERDIEQAEKRERQLTSGRKRRNKLKARLIPLRLLLSVRSKRYGRTI